jgi:signal transduction histidine kinase
MTRRLPDRRFRMTRRLPDRRFRMTRRLPDRRFRMTRRLAVTRVPRRGGVRSRLRHPKTTVRWRLTLLYGGLFLVSGAALLAITYTLVDHATVTNGPFRGLMVQAPATGSSGATASGGAPASGGSGLGPRTNFQHAPTVAGQGLSRATRSLPREQAFGGPAAVRSLPPQIQRLLWSQQGRIAIVTAGSFQRVSDLHQLVIESSIALAVMALISGALGWVVAGRVLSPLRTITDTTQRISEANLHERLALSGPHDELRRLAETIDALLGRLERAFDAQRRFVANASHELRTPLTAVRALLEMMMSDRDATVESFRETCAEVLQESAQQEQLIDALLALAQGQRGVDRPAPLDLAEIAGQVMRAHEAEAAVRGVETVAALDVTPVAGDRRLIERLIANLVENALRHNVAYGAVHVGTYTEGRTATLSVSNSGPNVPAEEVDRLLQPFQRLAADRVGERDGFGLGLSIVAAIADAHGAALDIDPRAEGGLDVDVRFPAAPQKSSGSGPGGSAFGASTTTSDPASTRAAQASLSEVSCAKPPISGGPARNPR